MRHDELTSSRNIALLGIVGTLVFSLLWIAAVIVDGSWVFGEITLSQLGNPERPADFIFNTACIVGGALLTFFAYGMLSHVKGFFLKASMSMTMLAAVSLFGLGVFPADVVSLHLAFSWVFFLSIAAAMALSIPGDWVSGGRGRMLSVVDLVILGGALSLLWTVAWPLTEAVTVIGIMVWIAIRSLDLLLS